MAKKTTKKGATLAGVPVVPAKAAPARKGRRLHIRADLASGGSLHVRHMADGDTPVQLDGVSIDAIALADKDVKPVWIQLAKPGTFKGHPAGPFELSEKVFSQIVANFKATVDQHIPIDFEHASESSPTEGSIPVAGAPAQGWIVDLKIDGGNLWGLVEWGALAREYIQAKKYKFFSPAIRFNARDRVTGANIGARLTSGALTNTPFLDALKPLAASDKARQVAGQVATAILSTSAYSPSEYMPRLRRILRLDDLASADECMEKLSRIEELLDEAGGDACAMPEGTDLYSYLYELREFVGAKPGMTWDEVFERIEECLEQAGAVPDRDSANDLSALSDDGDGDIDTEPVTPPAANPPTPSAGASVGMTGARTEETTTMDPKEIAQLQINLSTAEARVADTSTKLSAADAKATAAEAKAAELALTLKDEASKRAEAETELKTLRDAQSKRAEADAKSRVDEAFDTYKDSKKLGDADREAMVITLGSNPTLFEKLYPKVQPSQQHLLKNLSEGKDKENAGKGPPKLVALSVRDAAKALAAKTGVSLAAAQQHLLKNRAG